jgi:hypothetical protein
VEDHLLLWVGSHGPLQPGLEDPLAPPHAGCEFPPVEATVNIPAKALKDPPDTAKDIRRFIWQGLLLGILFMALMASLDWLLNLP